jgi:hypothetical protein
LQPVTGQEVLQLQPRINLQFPSIEPQRDGQFSIFTTG